MPKGPQGQKRKADVIGNAVLAVATDQGAYVLDNLASAVLPWTTTHYIGVAHQVGGIVNGPPLACPSEMIGPS